MTEPAYNFRVFYDPATGTIGGYEWANVPSEREGQDYLDYDHVVEWDPLKYKVDLETGTIVETDPAERAEQEAKKADADLARDIQQTIRLELDATLETQFPDYTDSEEERAQWSNYRRALRNLKGDDPAAILRTWPERPDQQDRIAHLRSRLTKG